MQSESGWSLPSVNMSCEASCYNSLQSPQIGKTDDYFSPLAACTAPFITMKN